MPDDEIGFILVISFVLVLLGYFAVIHKWSCEHCGIRDRPDVNGTHHEDDCPRSLCQCTCKFCGIIDTVKQVESKGRHHQDYCPRNWCRSKFCEIRPTVQQIRGKSIYHLDHCPHKCLHSKLNDDEKVPSPRCAIHRTRTILNEKAMPGIWEPQTQTIVPTSIQVNPNRLRFCQDSISEIFRDGSSVFRNCKDMPTILACFHEEADGMRLFALNNRTLFNAIVNDVKVVDVNIVEKPFDWEDRFTGRWPWMCIWVRRPMVIKQCALSSGSKVRIPAETITPTPSSSRCSIVLEARNLINPKKKNLTALIKEKCPDLDVQEPVDVERAYARVRVAEEDVPLVQCIVKAIAKDLGKNPNTVSCDEVSEKLRRFNSPRY